MDFNTILYSAPCCLSLLSSSFSPSTFSPSFLPSFLFFSCPQIKFEVFEDGTKHDYWSFVCIFYKISSTKLIGYYQVLIKENVAFIFIRKYQHF